MQAFLAPMMFGLAALVVPPLVLLYFLKLKRRDHPISSTLLWKRAVHDLQVNAPFQKLRKNLLFFLQLLILLAIVTALAQPMISGDPRAGKKFVLLMDNSASMNAVEEDGKTRLAIAKEEAITLVENMKDDDEAMIIAFGARADPVRLFTSQRGELIEGIKSIEPTDEQTRLEEALKLAEAHATPPRMDDNTPIPTGKPADLYIFSDCRIPDAGQLTIRRGAGTAVMIGKTTDNVAITEVGVRRSYEQPAMLSIFAVVRNFGGAPVEEFDIEFRMNGNLRNVQSTVLAAKGEDGDSMRLAVDEKEVVAGILEVRIARNDALAVDNKAWATYQAPRQLNVLLVTAGNYFLDKALRNLPLKSFEVLTPDEYEADARFAPRATRKDDFPEVIVLDGHSTERLPEGNYLFFGAAPKIEGVVDEGVVEKEYILAWDESHPALRYVNLDHRHASVFRWRRLKLPKESTILVEGETTPVMASFGRDGRRYLIVAFDIMHSRWPLVPGFQIFLYNAIPYLGGGVTAEERHIVRPGQAIRIASAAEEVVVTKPDGEKRKVDISEMGSAYFSDTSRVGVYEISETIVKPAAGVVNLLDPDESDIRPNDEFAIGVGLIETTTEIKPMNRPIWPWLAWGALAVVLLEWYVYNRRTYV